MGYDDWTNQMDAMFAVRFTKDDFEALKQALSDMINPVTIYTFIDDGCRYCGNTVKLMDIIAKASPTKNRQKLIKHVVVNRRDNEEAFIKYGVNRVPTVMLLDGYIRYIGMPAGEEIKGLVETIIRISRGESGLSKRTKEVLGSLRGKVVIEVLTTPLCPYCPYAALLANMFAFESYIRGSKAVIGEIIEAFENPDIADRYGIMSVPAVAINGKLEFMGVPYEDQLLNRVVKYSSEVFTKEIKEKYIKDIMKSIEEGEG